MFAAPCTRDNMRGCLDSLILCATLGTDYRFLLITLVLKFDSVLLFWDLKTFLLVSTASILYD